MKLFRKNSEVKNNSIVKKSFKKYYLNLADDELSIFISSRTISCIDDAFEFFNEVNYMISKNPLDNIIEISINSHQSSENNYYSNEYIKVSEHCNLNNVQEEIINKINMHYSEQGKRIMQRYVTTYRIAKF